MREIKGPAIFLAQFLSDQAPFNSLRSIARWAAELGYVGIQIPTSDPKIFDLQKAADSQAYCDEIRGVCAEARSDPTVDAASARNVKRRVGIVETYGPHRAGAAVAVRVYTAPALPRAC